MKLCDLGVQEAACLIRCSTAPHFFSNPTTGSSDIGTSMLYTVCRTLLPTSRILRVVFLRLLRF